MAIAPLRFERIAHRGSPTERLENTLSSFALALEHGADAIELDVHVTEDGRLVVHHDPVVGHQQIAETSWRQLSSIDLGGGATMPLLEDVFALVGDRVAIYIELKGHNIEDTVIASARKHGGRFALHSFDHEAMDRVADKAPDIARGILLDRGLPNPIDSLRRAAQRIRPRDAWPHWSLVDAEFMRAARDLGLRVISWTVNSPESATQLVTLGVAGICTDDVRLLAKLSER